ncbi:InlB B-repeat-containing protein [Slackia heliotrinireducens]|uniref:InlB B-repeat-containing protein n=1 Tax=Slackia heliotrinireducens TaxID=84110 RepID=UPI003314B4FD
MAFVLALSQVLVAPIAGGVAVAGDEPTDAVLEQNIVATPEDEAAEAPEATEPEDVESPEPDVDATTDEEPEQPVDEGAVDGEADVADTAEAVAYPAQTISATADDEKTVVTVTADEGVLPEGATVQAKVVDDQAVLDAVADEVENDGGKPGLVKAYDVIILDANGNEVQPQGLLTVTFANANMETDSVSVYHVKDVSDESEPPMYEAEGVVAMKAEANEQVFETDHFSIYAVAEDNKIRLKVQFFGKDQNAEVASMLLKKSETAADIEKIVYDPGAGELAEGELFRGWTTDPNYNADTQPMDIEAVRNLAAQRAAALGEDNTELKLYAMIMKSATVTYVDENGIALGSTTKEQRYDDSTPVDYTVNMAYTPPTSEQDFEGWNVLSGESNIVGHTDGKVYENGTNIKVTGDVTFSVNAPTGRWLVFDENGKGATYNSPQFVKSGEVTEEPPLEMHRTGYEFKGWYTDAACTAGNEFTFGQTLTNNTTIYAKWTPVSNAQYTVIIWKQNVAGDGYDFEEAIHLTGAANSTVNSISQRGTGDNAYASVNGENKQYTGFHLKEFDQNVTIAPEGNTVVNVYYDRTEYTFTFQVEDYTYTQSNSGGYGKVGDTYVRLGGSGNNRYYLAYADGTPVPSGTTVYYRASDFFGSYWDDTVDPTSTNTTFYSAEDYGTELTWTRYSGDRFNRSNRKTWQTIKTITALYEQNISDEFPIVGTNGVTYPTGTRWMPQSNLTVDGQKYFTTNVVVAYVDRMTPGSMTFRWSDPGEKTDKTMVYWIETIDGTPSDPNAQTKTYKGKLYEEYKTVVAKYTGVTVEDYINLEGFAHYEADKPLNYTLNGTTYYGTTTGYYNEIASEVNFYYTRDKYTIHYMDGVYVDGDGKPQDESGLGDLGTSDPILYYADISSYNQGGDDYYAPTRDGYTFSGWYIDEACTHPYTFDKMPQGGVTVYAKWTKNQYRVFLHPNAGTDPTLDWGSDNQQMNFRVSSGEKVSTPTGLRSEYELVGWYLDEACTHPYPASFVLNDTTVTTPYDKTTDMTDVMDKWGNGATTNADVDRPWITKKLDLYAKWRAKIEGAKGIGVVYDANGGTNGPTDPLLYLDNSDAIAQAASTAPEGKQFKYWVVQTWDEAAGEYVDTETHVYPGDAFTVLKANAKVENVSSQDPEVWKAYTVQLRAEYVDKGSPETTVVLFDANGGTLSDGKTTDERVLEVNGDVEFPTPDPTREGYTFLGWSPEKVDPVTDPSEVSTILDTSKEYAADNLAGLAWNATEGKNILYAVWQKTSVKLVIQKELEGDMADLTKGFTFTVTRSGDGATATTDALHDAQGPAAAGETATVENLTLDSKEVPLYWGDSVVITETDTTGYTTTYTVQLDDEAASNPEAYGNGATVKLDADVTTVVFTNTKEPVVITGVKAAVKSPISYVLLIGSLIALQSVVLTRTRRRRWQE